MCIGGSSAAPAAPVLPPAPPPAPTLADPAVATARANEKSAADLMQGRASTILSSPQGDLNPANTAKKTALGQ